MEAVQSTIPGLVAGLPEEAFTDLMVRQELRHGTIRQQEDTDVRQVYKAGTEVVQQQVPIIPGQEITPEPIRDIMPMHNGDTLLPQMGVSG